VQSHMKIRGFKSEVWLPLAPAELFDFFSDASNLHVLTPPWLHLRVLTPMPVEMKPGASIDYRMRVHGLPVRWRTRITLWDPPHRFDDEQIIGPYRRWLHTHTFEKYDGGTNVCDLISYAVPLDFLTHRLFVRPDIEKIFGFRSHELTKRFSRRK
jgi:ligand-binding SRPBCC domain-containing protein